MSGNSRFDDIDSMLDSEDANELLSAIDYMDEFSEKEKDNIRSSIIKEKEKAFQDKLLILKDEWDKAKLIVTGLRTQKAPKEEIIEAEKFSKTCYDRYRRFKTDSTLDVPDNIYDLLEIAPCSKAQKRWLLTYCHNNGNAIDACSKASISLKMYRRWKTASDDSEANKAFKEALEEVEQAFLEVAEMNLKSLAGSKVTAALIFFLKNKHNDYKPTAKLLQDNKDERKNGMIDFNAISPANKHKEFMQVMGSIKENNLGEDEVKPL